MQIEGAGVVVTGGAGGLGGATAQRLARRGAAVAVLDLDPFAGDPGPGTVTSFGCDVTDPDEVEAAVGEAWSAVGPLRAVVNCAGGGGRPGVVVPPEGDPMPLPDFAAKIELNLYGTVNVIRSAVARIRDLPDVGGERGVVVNTASVAAYDGQVGQVAYAAAKGAVVAMTLPLARELARYRVRVVALAPGIFATPRIASFPAALRERLAAEVQHPARLGDPDEFAALVEHVIDNPMLNGEVIRLDGALRMPPRS